MPHRHVARKVTIAIALGVIAVLATAGFAYRTVERVRIGSDEFGRLRQRALRGGGSDGRQTHVQSCSGTPDRRIRGSASS